MHRRSGMESVVVVGVRELVPMETWERSSFWRMLNGDDYFTSVDGYTVTLGFGSVIYFPTFLLPTDRVDCLFAFVALRLLKFESALQFSRKILRTPSCGNQSGS